MEKSLDNLLYQCKQLSKIKEEVYEETKESFRSGVAWGESLAYRSVADTLEAILKKEDK